MEPESKRPTPKAALPSPDTNTFAQARQAPGFALDATIQREVATPGPDQKYADFEKDNHGHPMDYLVDTLMGKPGDFLAGVREYVLAGKGLSGNQGRTLAAVEAVIGLPYSPVAKTWIQAAEYKNPDQVKAIRDRVGKKVGWSVPEANLGSKHTSSPVANLGSEPNLVIRKEVMHEMWMYECSKVFMAWATKKMDKDSGQASFNFKDLTDDKGLLGTVRGVTAKLVDAQFSAEYQKIAITNEYFNPDYNWILRFMVYNGVLTPPTKANANYTFVKADDKTMESFSKKSEAVSKIQKEVRATDKAQNPTDGLSKSEEFPAEWSSDKRQLDIQTLLAEVEEENEKEHPDPKVIAAKKAKIAALKNSGPKGYDPAFRTVAAQIMPLLERLKKINPSGFSMGSYKGHQWGNFSADIFINKAGLKADGFWATGPVNQFFEDLNKAAEMDESPKGAGKYAWQAIYNDTAVAAVTNAKFGANRQLTGVEGHGPGDRMHIHLNLRPLELKHDSYSGYKKDTGGRILPF